jgi:hypothetical protein
MAYFPNGTSGGMYREQYCDRCKWDKDQNCPIWAAHLMHNYEECNKEDSILHMLIPRSKDRLDNEECFFFEAETADMFASPQAGKQP